VAYHAIHILCVIIIICVIIAMGILMHVHRGVHCQPKADLGRGIPDVIGHHRRCIIRIGIFVIVHGPFGRNRLFFLQVSYEIPRIATKRIAGELAEGLERAGGIRRPRVGREQYGGAQAVGIPPLYRLTMNLW